MAEPKKLLSSHLIINLLLVIVIAPLLPLIISGDWGWKEAWAYAIFSVLAFIISRLLAGRRHPDLITERSRFMESGNTKSWDKALAPLLGLGSILILVVAGFDHYYGWSAGFPEWLNIIALIMIIIGYSFSSWALVENKFFSGTVRIQTERGHHVIDSGPYRIMRHPGYAGGLLGFVFIPILLDSVWAYIPSMALAGVMVVRTHLEDKTLQEELPGYKEFSLRTRYRLIPWVW